MHSFSLLRLNRKKMKEKNEIMCLMNVLCPLSFPIKNVMNQEKEKKEPIRREMCSLIQLLTKFSHTLSAKCVLRVTLEAFVPSLLPGTIVHRPLPDQIACQAPQVFASSDFAIHPSNCSWRWRTQPAFFRLSFNHRFNEWI